MAEAQAPDDVATAFDLEDSDEDGKSKTDAEASLERNVPRPSPVERVVAGRRGVQRCTWA